MEAIRIHERIKYLIELFDLSQARLARRAGLSPPTLSRLLTAEADPRFATVEAIYRALPGTNPHWLLTGEGTPLQQGQVPSPALRVEDGQPAYGLPPQTVEPHHQGQDADARVEELMAALVECQDRVIRLMEEKEELRRHAGQ